VSGLAALFERDGAPAAEARITGMLARLAHRGPDRRAHLALGPVALAHARLEITAEDALAEEPLASPGARIWVSADARLDNRQALLAARRAAGEAGDEPLSDAGLILWAYQRWGRDCPAKLLGDFAFVIWDEAAQRLFCARDHLGVRPLYYHADARTFRAASEMHALFADERVPRRPDEHAMALFLTDQYTEARETLWSGVLALPAGHHLTVTGRSLREERYWQLDPSRRIRHRDASAYAESFRETFEEAVRSRLRSRWPVAAHVSGGLDSSSVACVAERLRRAGEGPEAPLLLLRCAYPGLACDERDYSQSVADHLGLSIETFSPPDDPELCRPLPESAPSDDYFEPTTRMFAPLLTMASRRGVRVTLTGLGGDQIMRRTGAECVYAMRRGRLFAATKLAGLTRRPFSLSAWKTLLRDTLRAYVSPRATLPVRALLRPLRDRWPWTSPAVARAAMKHKEDLAHRDFERYPDPVARDFVGQIESGQNTSLSLTLSDRLAARGGAELRHPFFDVRLVELVLAFPHHQLFDGEFEKPVLRRAMQGILPERVRARRHVTHFTDYLCRHVIEAHGAAIEGLLAHGMLARASLVDVAAIEKLLATRSRDALSLLSPLALELWLRKNADKCDDCR
jgi:asparagine synthase (glutamine-hydrolysing)